MRIGTHGMMQVDYEQRIDFDRMREYRVARIKKYMNEFDIECLLLFESGNKRYSTSTAVASPEVDNMGRYAIVPHNGYPHIFGFGSEVAAEKLYSPWIKDTTLLQGIRTARGHDPCGRRAVRGTAHATIRPLPPSARGRAARGLGRRGH